MGNRLEGKVVVVTGSSSGNGRATAPAFAREGTAVVCSNVRKSAREEGYEGYVRTGTDDVIYRKGGCVENLASDDAEMVAGSIRVPDGGYAAV